MLPPPEQIGNMLGYPLGWILGNFTLPILCCGIMPLLAIIGVGYAGWINVIKPRRNKRAPGSEQVSIDR